MLAAAPLEPMRFDPFIFQIIALLAAVAVVALAMTFWSAWQWPAPLMP